MRYLRWNKKHSTFSVVNQGCTTLPVCRGLMAESDGFSSHWGSALNQPLLLWLLLSQILLTSRLILNRTFDIWVKSCMARMVYRQNTASLSGPVVFTCAQPSHPSSCFHFLIFLPFLLSRLPVSFLCPCLLYVPLLPLNTCSESPAPTQRLRCHAFSQINVELLTSDGPGRHRSSEGRGEENIRPGQTVPHGWYVTQQLTWLFKCHSFWHEIPSMVNLPPFDTLFQKALEVQARWRKCVRI